MKEQDSGIHDAGSSGSRQSDDDKLAFTVLPSFVLSKTLSGEIQGLPLHHSKITHKVRKQDAPPRMNSQFAGVILALTPKKDQGERMGDFFASLFIVLKYFSATDALSGTAIATTTPEFRICPSAAMHFIAIPIVGTTVNKCPVHSVTAGLMALERKLEGVVFPKSHFLRHGIHEDVVAAIGGLHILEFCNYMGVITDVFTVHDAKTSIINFMDYKQVLKYYGPQATLYVVFMREYLKWLRLPALLGLVAWVI